MPREASGQCPENTKDPQSNSFQEAKSYQQPLSELSSRFSPQFNPSHETVALNNTLLQPCER